MKEEEKLQRQVTKVINNKTIHFELTGSVHKRLRVMLFLKELSMQKFFRLMAEKLVEGDEYIVQLVEDKVSDLKERKVSNLREICEKDLYNVIEENSPIGKNKQDN